MRKRHDMSNNLIVNILFYLSAMLFIISIAVIITVNFKPLYYADIKLLNISEVSGYSKNVIKNNYNTLIKYCSPFFKGELNFPSLPMSDTGRIHFEEVKVIFTNIYILALICGIISLIIIILKLKNEEFHYLRSIAVFSTILPLVVCAAIAINFSYAFELFHKIFFNNDYWEFDPITDPIINILPSTFFMHCAIMIVLLVLIFNLIIFIFYKRLKSIHDDKYIK